ncbi:MAG: adenylyltransferase/cytidyltransferase family protein [Candidatus Binatia bacterium]
MEANTVNLKHHWRYDKILTTEEARHKADQLREEGKRLVTMNGSFDLLHAGHLDFLEEARQQGDILFVGVNSDQSVRGGKGSTRPIIPEMERMALLAALECVDYVVKVNGEYSKEPIQTLLPAIRPHVHANGEDYGAPETWIEWPTMQQYGTQAYMVKRRPNLATSDIIDKIKTVI